MVKVGAKGGGEGEGPVISGERSRQSHYLLGVLVSQATKNVTSNQTHS